MLSATVGNNRTLRIYLIPVMMHAVLILSIFFYPEATFCVVLLLGAVAKLMQKLQIRLTEELGKKIFIIVAQLMVLIWIIQSTRIVFQEIPGGSYGYEIVGGCMIPDRLSASSGKLMLNHGGEGGDFLEGMNRSPPIKDLWSINSLACPAREKEKILKYGFMQVELNKDPQTITRKVVSSKRRLHSTVEDPCTDDNLSPASPQEDVKTSTSRSLGGSGIKALVLVGAAAVYGGYCYYTGKPILPQGWWWKDMPQHNVH
jgi:hypothetical protein